MIFLPYVAMYLLFISTPSFHRLSISACVYKSSGITAGADTVKKSYLLHRIAPTFLFYHIHFDFSIHFTPIFCNYNSNHYTWHLSKICYNKNRKRQDLTRLCRKINVYANRLSCRMGRLVRFYGENYHQYDNFHNYFEYNSQ